MRLSARGLPIPPEWEQPEREYPQTPHCPNSRDRAALHRSHHREPRESAEAGYMTTYLCPDCRIAGGAEWYQWRPSDYPEIERTLRERKERED